MTQSQKNTPNAYAVGYGKPPAHTRFRKGQSGNPGGRPRGMTAGRAMALALKELYRSVAVREGGKVRKLPAFQAVLRSQIATAVKGNVAAQRAVFEMARAIEHALAAQKSAEDKVKDILSPREKARRIAFLLHAGLQDDPTVPPRLLGASPMQLNEVLAHYVRPDDAGRPEEQ